MVSQRLSLARIVRRFLSKEQLLEGLHLSKRNLPCSNMLDLDSVIWVGVIRTPPMVPGSSATRGPTRRLWSRARASSWTACEGPLSQGGGADARGTFVTRLRYHTRVGQMAGNLALVRGVRLRTIAFLHLYISTALPL